MPRKRTASSATVPPAVRYFLTTGERSTSRLEGSATCYELRYGPLGSERQLGGHKGYALSAMVDILTSVLSGANWGPFAPPFALRQEIPSRSVGKGIGHFFGAMEIEGFMDVDEFKTRIDEWIYVFRKTRPAKGTHVPLIPSDPEPVPTCW